MVFDGRGGVRNQILVTELTPIQNCMLTDLFMIVIERPGNTWLARIVTLVAPATVVVCG